MKQPSTNVSGVFAGLAGLARCICLMSLLLLFSTHATASIVMAVSMDQAVASADYIVEVKIIAGEAFFFDESVDEGLQACGGVYRAKVLDSIKGNPGQEISFGAGSYNMLVPGELYLLFLDERGGVGVETYMLEPQTYASCTDAFPDTMAQWRFSSRIHRWPQPGGFRRWVVDYPIGIDLRDFHADWPNYLGHPQYVDSLRATVTRQANFPLDPADVPESIHTAAHGYPAFIYVSWPVSGQPEQEPSADRKTIEADIVRAGMAGVVDDPDILDSCRNRFGADVFYVVPNGASQRSSIFDYWTLDCQPARPNNLATCVLMPGKGLWSDQIGRLIDVSSIGLADANAALDAIPLEMDLFGKAVPLKRITRTSYGHLSMTYGFCECSFYHSVAIEDWENLEIDVDTADFGFCD